MKRLGRILLLALGVIVAVIAVLLLGVNLYVQSQGTQARIQQELSQRLGTTLHIRRISVTPWWGLKLSGITIPQGDKAIPGDFLEAKTFRLRVRLMSLFSQRLVIKELSLINPHVVWAQNRNGKWRIPVSPQYAASSEDSENLASAAPAPAAAPGPAAGFVSPPGLPGPPAPQGRGSAPAPPLEIQSGEAAPFTPEIRRVSLSGGRFEFLDAKGKPVATFDGVRFRSTFRSAKALRGTASIAKTSLRDRFFLEQLQSPLEYGPAEMDFSRISARAGGGEITGRFAMRPQTPGSPFTVNVNFRDVQADRIVSDAGGTAGIVQGRLEGRLEANGKTADANALTGTGEIFLRDGHVQQYSLLVAAGQLLQIDELMELHLQEAHIKYHIDPGVVTVDELLLSSPNIRLSAMGTITFAGELELESQLAVSERIRAQLFRSIRENFQPTEAPGYAAVNFQVSGPVDRPRTNLMEKLMPADLQDLGGVIDSLLGGKKSDRPKKKKSKRAPAAETEAAPSPPLPDASLPPGTPAPLEPAASP